MSEVTTVILTMAIREPGFDKVEGNGTSLDRVNQLLDNYGKAPLVDLTPCLERNKLPNCLTFGGSYGSFPEADFVNLIQSFEWEDPDSVVLILHREISYTAVWRPRDGKERFD